MMYGFSGHSWGGMSPWSTFGFGAFGILIALAVAVIVIALKGYALWHAARRSEKWWFIALLLINTIGILELIYLYFIVGKWQRFKDNGTPPTTHTPASTPPSTPPSTP